MSGQEVEDKTAELYGSFEERRVEREKGKEHTIKIIMDTNFYIVATMVKISSFAKKFHDNPESVRAAMLEVKKDLEKADNKLAEEKRALGSFKVTLIKIKKIIDSTIDKNIIKDLKDTEVYNLLKPFIKQLDNLYKDLNDVLTSLK